MKNILLLSFSFITTFVAWGLFMSSLPPYSDTFFLPLLIIAFGAIMISLTVAIWTEKQRKLAFLDSLKYSLGLSALIFMLGYLFTSIAYLF